MPNCIICAKEFDPEENESEVSTQINYTTFKVCDACIQYSDPSKEYEEVKKIVSWYNDLQDNKIYKKILKISKASKK